MQGGGGECGGHGKGGADASAGATEAAEPGAGEARTPAGAEEATEPVGAAEAVKASNAVFATEAVGGGCAHSGHIGSDGGTRHGSHLCPLQHRSRHIGRTERGLRMCCARSACSSLCDRGSHCLCHASPAGAAGAASAAGAVR